MVIEEFINGLPFNIDKCAVLHIGGKTLHDFTRGREEGREFLKMPDAGKDLGVIIDCALKLKEQVSAAIAKAIPSPGSHNVICPYQHVHIAPSVQDDNITLFQKLLRPQNPTMMMILTFSDMGKFPGD